MDLYLVRHGEAFDEETDPERSLTLQGRADVDTVAAFARRHAGMTVSCVFHSTKKRAVQTAEIIAEHMVPESAEPSDGLLPNDDPGIWVERLARRNDSIMLVGHLPHLNRLASRLLIGKSNREIVWFGLSTILALSRDETGFWWIRWMLTPDVVS